MVQMNLEFYSQKSENFIVSQLCLCAHILIAYHIMSKFAMNSVWLYNHLGEPLCSPKSWSNYLLPL